jgi:dienelactone hydrolase
MPPPQPRSSATTSGGSQPELPSHLHPMRTSIVILSLVLASLNAVAAEDPGLFAYDKSAPLDVQELGIQQRGSAKIHDLTFIGVKTPVKAYLVTPAESQAQSHAAILYAHWLGASETSNRTEFLGEAVTLAEQGVVSLLVDTMWADPKWYGERVPEEDYNHSVRQVIELRRAMDLLLNQPGVDSRRVAFVGHDFGAMYGMIASAQDLRARTYVFMAAVPHLIDWFLFARQPRDPESYRRQIAPLDPINFIGRLAPASVFFQFANQDKYVSAGQAAAFYSAAMPCKQTTTYVGGHDLHTSIVAADRVAWLERELDLKK